MPEIAIIGYGRSGRGAEKLAQKQHLQCSVFCDGESRSGNIDFSAFELVVVSPGVPPLSPLYQIATVSGVEIVSELEFAFRFCPRSILAITGTNGKTTATELCAGILNSAGIKAQCCGNIGTSLSEALCVEESALPEVFVAEVSSFQLERIKDFAPFAAAIINISDDHLDRYDGSFERYRQVKKKIFNHVPESRRFRGQSPCGSPPEYFVNFSRVHLRENLSVALNLAIAFAGAEKIICNAVKDYLDSFTPQPHRQEIFLRHNSLTFVDDSKATNVASTIAAIDAFAPDFKDIFLILGGLDKDMDFSPLNSRSNCLSELFIYGQCRRKIYDQLENCCNCRIFEKFDDAVAAAVNAACSASLVLLSPACASMDQFTDYRERGDRFKSLAKRMMDEKR